MRDWKKKNWIKREWQMQADELYKKLIVSTYNVLTINFKGEGADFPDGEAELKTGVPHIIVDITAIDVNGIEHFLFDEHKIPSVEEVSITFVQEC